MIVTECDIFMRDLEIQHKRILELLDEIKNYVESESEAELPEKEEEFSMAEFEFSLVTNESKCPYLQAKVNGKSVKLLYLNKDESGKLYVQLLPFPTITGKAEISVRNIAGKFYE
jgi:hypothetical protein